MEYKGIKKMAGEWRRLPAQTREVIWLDLDTKELFCGDLAYGFNTETESFRDGRYLPVAVIRAGVRVPMKDLEERVAEALARYEAGELGLNYKEF